jgi:plastocyanin
MRNNIIAGFAFLMVLAASAQAEDYVLTIKDHKFEPKELVIPANQKVKITVRNNDDTAEEFESSQLKREKVVAAHGEIVVLVGPLKAGSYAYKGEFHEATAQGTIIAK